MRGVRPRRQGPVLAVAVTATIAVVAAAAVLASLPGAPAPAPASAELFRDRTAAPVAARLREAAAAWRGGPMTTSTGEHLTVYVSDAYTDDQNSPQEWADFFAGLVHGSELSLLTVYVAAPQDIQSMCGADASGCFGSDQIVLSGQQMGSATPTMIATHEYGHHVAAHRNNAPWIALDWGTKRWASYATICTRAAAGTAFPGNEDASYKLNPGEGFAEVYRLLNESKAGATSFSWPIVDTIFYPDAAAMSQVEQDVLQPWTTPTATTMTGRFRPRGTSVWALAVPTALDGEFRASLVMPAGTLYDFALLGPDRKTVLVKGLWSGKRSKSIAFVVCGQRTLFLTVTRHATAGPFTVQFSRP
jgi:hypothetical protein